LAVNKNQTQPTGLSVAAFIDKIPDPAQRADAKALAKLLQSASGEKPKMWGPAIIGFGAYHYKYESGREGDMPLVAFSPRKAGLVLYHLTRFAGADALLAKLGKYKTTGKACLNIKKLSDVDHAVLKELALKASAAVRAR
jgi:hypothetical protein